MQDLRRRAGVSYAAVQDSRLPDWRKIERGLTAFSDMELNDIPVGVYRRIEREFCVINAVFSQYPIKTWQDYAVMSPEHVREVLDRIASVCLAVRCRR